MKYRHFLIALSLCLAAVTPGVMAAGTFIPAPQRKDMVYDDLRDIVFITNGDRVLRYHVSSGTLLAPIITGGRLTGIDLSPDGNTLVIADGTSNLPQVSVFLVPVRPVSGTGYLRIRKLSIAKAFGEGGIHSLAYASDGTILLSSDYLGSGYVPLRRLNPATSGWTTLLNSVGEMAMLSASGDRDTVVFVEGSVSSGGWGLLDVPTGGLLHWNGYPYGTNGFNYEVAADRTGSQVTITVFGGTVVYNDAHERLGVIGDQNGRPLAAAYHPVQRMAYFPWQGTRNVRVYDMNTFTHIGNYDFENNFTTINAAYAQGRTRIARDGSLLMVTVANGVRILRMYAPLQAAPVSFTAIQDSDASIPLLGSIGNGDALVYSLATSPQNGQASVVGQRLIYTPRPGFTGTDSFSYRVRYGGAARDAPVSVQVVPNGRQAAVERPRIASGLAAITRIHDRMPLRTLAGLSTGTRLPR